MIRALRTPVGLLAGAIILALLFLVIAAPSIWGEDATRIAVEEARQGISAEHPLGTDELGRDIMARIFVGARFSLVLAIIAVLIASTLGIALGALMLLLGPRARRVLSEVNGILLAFPGLLFAMVVATVVGVGAKGAVLAIGIGSAPGFARLTQTLGASIANSDYVVAARLVGVRRVRLLTRHLLPNIAEPLILQVTLAVGSALLVLSGLSFLGLGVQPPDYDWGRMLGDGLSRIYVTPVAALAPGAAIILGGLAFTLLGEVMAKAAGKNVSHQRHKQPHPAPATEAATSSAVPERPDAVLRVRGLTVSFPEFTAVRGVDLDITRGEIVGIVGESGSGKSLTSLAIAQLVPYPGVVSASTLEFEGRDLLTMDHAERARLLGTALPMVFQDPMSSLNPALKLGVQLTEAVRVHRGMSRKAAEERAIDRLKRVHITRPAGRLAQYPHELSGGMRQRVMLAMGLMGEPGLIIADEPTTALDVTVQRRVLDLLRSAAHETNAGVILISHDVAVVAGLCHRVLVMYAGRVVEELDTATLTTAPAHPYTRALLAATPDLDADRSLPMVSIPGRPPDPRDTSQGCSFADRCALASQRCRQQRPPLVEFRPGQRVACWDPQSAPLRALEDQHV